VLQKKLTCVVSDVVDNAGIVVREGQLLNILLILITALVSSKGIVVREKQP
jgi:hypothetical protein